MLEINYQSIGFTQVFLSKLMELNQPHLIREQKGLISQDQSGNTIALTTPNYVGHQINHVLAIVEESVNFFGGRVYVCHCFGPS